MIPWRPPRWRPDCQLCPSVPARGSAGWAARGGKGWGPGEGRPFLAEAQGPKQFPDGLVFRGPCKSRDIPGSDWGMSPCRGALGVRGCPPPSRLSPAGPGESSLLPQKGRPRFPGARETNKQKNPVSKANVCKRISSPLVSLRIKRPGSRENSGPHTWPGEGRWGFSPRPAAPRGPHGPWGQACGAGARLPCRAACPAAFGTSSHLWPWMRASQ